MFKDIESKIVIKMVNREKSGSLLDGLVYREILDLAAVYYILADPSDISSESDPVSTSMLESWNVAEDELFEIAAANLKNIMEIDMKNILLSLLDMMQEDGDDSYIMSIFKDDIKEVVEEEDDNDQMFVITGKNRVNGAAVLAMPDVLGDFADRLDSDLVIIPASKNEIICLRDHEQFDFDVLKKAILEVNAGIVLEEDFLSNHAYRFIRHSSELIFAE